MCRDGFVALSRCTERMDALFIVTLMCTFCCKNGSRTMVQFFRWYKERCLLLLPGGTALVKRCSSRLGDDLFLRQTRYVVWLRFLECGRRG